MFRYPTNQRLEITLRHLRGETAVALSKEFGVTERSIRRWKKIAVEAIEARLRGTLVETASPLTRMKRAMADIAAWNIAQSSPP